MAKRRKAHTRTIKRKSNRAKRRKGMSTRRVTVKRSR